jgi:hypothetical protein
VQVPAGFQREADAHEPVELHAHRNPRTSIEESGGILGYFMLFNKNAKNYI